MATHGIDPQARGLALQYQGSGGSALVGFLQAGTGAVTRTLQAKGRDVISVKDFGALGDAATNDRAAIQAAIDAAVALGGGKVYFPTGIYLFGSQITIGAGVTLVGDGPTDGVGTAAPSTLRRNYDSGAGIVFTGDHSGLLDIGIDGNSNAGDLVQVVGSRFHLRNTSLIKAGQDNLRIGDNNSGNTYNSNLWRLDRLICLNAGRYGVHVHDGKAAPDVNAGLATGIDVAGCTNHGFYMERAWDTTLVNVVAQTNSGTGIRIGEASKNTVVYSPYTEANGNNELVIDAGALNTRVLGTRSGVSTSGYVDNGTGSQILQTRSGITGYYWNKLTIGGLGAGITAILDLYAGVNEINAGKLIGRDGAVGTAGEVAIQVKRNGDAPIDRLVLSDGAVTLSANTSLIVTTSQTPASAAATGTAGTIAWDSGYLYVCTATDTWKRVAIATW